ARPGLEGLTLSLAGRYEDYTDAGNSVNPKIGLLWRPTADFTFRASYGTSFNTARYSQTITTFNALVVLDEPSSACAAATCRVIYDSGNRIDYKPERSKSFSTGIDYAPQSLAGLKLSLGYYDIHYTDRIGDLPASGDVLANVSAFSSISV